jgi:hypothetical protein
VFNAKIVTTMPLMLLTLKTDGGWKDGKGEEAGNEELAMLDSVSGS